jgi:hypothetical protein
VSPDFIEKAKAKVVETYGTENVRFAEEGMRTLVRIASIDLYEGCSPRTTPLLLVLDKGQPKPLPYVQTGQRLANGREPKSSSPQLIGGESWLHFSFSIPWEEAHGITRFIAAARQRFAQSE